MQRLFVAVACRLAPLAMTYAAILSWPAPAHAHQDCGVSFMILPNGECLELTYLGILGRGRSNMAQVEQIYRRQFNANVALEVIYSRYPETDRETAEERQARYESLAETSLIRDDVAESTQTIEAMLYPLQVQSMSIVGIAFSKDRQ